MKLLGEVEGEEREKEKRKKKPTQSKMAFVLLFKTRVVFFFFAIGEKRGHLKQSTKPAYIADLFLKKIYKGN